MSPRSSDCHLPEVRAEISDPELDGKFERIGKYRLAVGAGPSTASDELGSLQERGLQAGDALSNVRSVLRGGEMSRPAS